ncbi:MAG: sensor domain-containing diguanylate cyclase, partial [Clostridia bacterium]
NKAKNTELALKIDDERYKIAMQSTGDIIIDYDMKTHIMYHSLKAKEIYGVPEFIENMPQSILDKGVVLSETKDEYLDLFRQLSNGVKKCSAVIKTRGIDGSILWNMLSFTSIFDDEGNVARAIGVLQDITREKSIEILQKRDERYLEISGSEGTSYYEVDLTNRCFIYGPENIMKTNSSTNDFNTVLKAIISENIYADDCEFVFENSRIEMLVNNYNSGISHTTIEFRKIFKDSIIWVECSMQCFVDDTTGDLHCVGSIRNINEMKVKELLLKEKAERDLLTGLYNKITTEILIKNLTDFAEKGEVSGAFLVIDLDNFKNINDTFGHISGDEVLVKVAKKLIAIFRDGDIIGRIGGDEFVVYMNHVDSPIIVGKKAMQVCDMFRKIEISGALDCRIKGSVGISIFPTYGKNFEELYKNADKALYAAKRQGKDKYIQYTENL